MEPHNDAANIWESINTEADKLAATPGGARRVHEWIDAVINRVIAMRAANGLAPATHHEVMQVWLIMTIQDARQLQRENQAMAMLLGGHVITKDGQAHLVANEPDGLDADLQEEACATLAAANISTSDLAERILFPSGSNEERLEDAVELARRIKEDKPWCECKTQEEKAACAACSDECKPAPAATKMGPLAVAEEHDPACQCPFPARDAVGESGVIPGHCSLCGLVVM